MTRKRMLRSILNFGRSELDIQNAETLQTPGISTIQLPPLFAIWRHGEHTRTGIVEEQSNAYTAVLIAVSRAQPTHQTQPNLWKFELVQQPIEAIYHGTCESSIDHWLGNSSPTIIIRRESSFPEESGKLYITTLTHTGYMIRCHNTGTRIPVLNMTHKCRVLPSRFTTIDSPGNTSWRFTLHYGSQILAPTYIRRVELQRTAIAMAERSAQQLLERSASGGGGGAGGGSARGGGAVGGGGAGGGAGGASSSAGQAMSPQGAGPAEIPIQSLGHVIHQQRFQGVQEYRVRQQQTLPQHIVNAYIDDIIRKGEECPIEMAPLTRENAALTPCGHAVQQSAGTRWILGARSCPVCRVQCSSDQLQTWKA